MDTNFLEQIFWGNTLKQYAFFVGIIIVGLLFKRIVSRIFSQLIFRLFKKFADEVNSETFIGLLLKPIEFFISLSTLYIAINQLKHPLNVAFFRYKKNKINEVFTIGEFVDKIFLFLIILSVFWIVLRIVDFIAHVLLVRAAKTHNKADDQLVPFLKELLKFMVCFVGFFVLLGYVFEVNAVSLITGLGIGGIAIAMAAKDSLENLLGSFLIFMDKPFTVGDVVKVDGIEGTIERVGFRSTVLRSADKTTYVIPNRSMIDGVLENLTMRNARRVKFDIGLVYETSNEVLKKIIAEINGFLAENPKTTDSSVAFDSFGDSALNLQIIYLVPMKKEFDLAKIKEEVNFKLIEIVQANGSDFAYPTQRSIEESASEKNNK
ncbi:mechanosensitive ion channel family protein [Pedobacter sp. SL55]|uniref:mechanosensitive ion channel family protein n=1 Tax=Pedobacter sp. SL55 TaxID=2995161 RepID=UPI00226E3C17|nr:mechanosensitive ion channel family protein [Pedobacter sp. SL55]WAC42078.1 mechanosensitive ion channel family protein [Pedobacter sp. SL55]